MGLSIKEGTRQDTFEKLKNIASAPFPVGYVKVESWRVVPDDPSYDCVLALYYDEQTRIDTPDAAQHYIMGSSIQDADFTEMTKGDDRQHLYKQIEYIIHYQHYEKTIDRDDKNQVETANAELQTLAQDLGIDTLFMFNAVDILEEKQE